MFQVFTPVFIPFRGSNEEIVLGNGAFSTVILVKDQFGRKFAYKKCNRMKYLQNTIKEAKIMTKLGQYPQHPNIMELIIAIPRTIRYENGVDIVMPKCDGSLLDLIEERYRKVGFGLTEPVLLDLVQDLVNGLTFMQSKNVTHCDLKPENVLYVLDNTRQSGYRFIIADFGGAEEVAVVNRRIQTNHYRCPENLLNKKNDIRACDFFSLGCILYTAITSIILIHYKEEKNITELQIEERQIIRILQLIGTDFIQQFNNELDYSRFMKHVGKKGEIHTDPFLLASFKDMDYKFGSEWISYIQNMLIPFPSQRLDYVCCYPGCTLEPGTAIQTETETDQENHAPVKPKMIL